jgi:hypothetical protein
MAPGTGRLKQHLVQCQSPPPLHQPARCEAAGPCQP